MVRTTKEATKADATTSMIATTEIATTDQTHTEEAAKVEATMTTVAQTLTDHISINNITTISSSSIILLVNEQDLDQDRRLMTNDVAIDKLLYCGRC